MSEESVARADNLPSPQKDDGGEKRSRDRRSETEKLVFSKDHALSNTLTGVLRKTIDDMEEDTATLEAFMELNSAVRIDSAAESAKDELEIRTNAVVRAIPDNVETSTEAKALARYALADLLNILVRQDAVDDAIDAVKALVDAVLDRAIKEKHWIAAALWTRSFLQTRSEGLEEIEYGDYLSSYIIIFEYFEERALAEVERTWDVGALELCLVMARKGDCTETFGVGVAGHLIRSPQLLSPGNFEKLLAFVGQSIPLYRRSGDRYMAKWNGILSKVEAIGKECDINRQLMALGLKAFCENELNAPAVVSENPFSMCYGI